MISINAYNSITDVLPPFGGYERFNNLRLGEDYLPIWLQKVHIQIQLIDIYFLLYILMLVIILNRQVTILIILEN